MSAEASQQLIHDGDDVASSSGYISSQQNNNHRHSVITEQSSGTDPSAASSSNRNNNPKLFVKRGSLTINSMPQQFNYNEESAISGTTAMITTPLIERQSQESSAAHHELSGHQINACEQETGFHNNDDSDADLLDDGTSGRQSSSSHQSSQVPSWRPWVDTTCCFGYIHLRCTWIFHPQGPLSYIWLLIVSIAVIHNIIHIPLRFAFCGWNMNLGLAATTDDILRGASASSALTAIPDTFSSWDLAFWMVPDYLFDLIYALDILKSMRTGYFEEGFMNSHPQAIFSHYVGSASFYADVVSLLPLDLLYLSFGLNSLLRIPRIIKIYRCFQFVNWTERHTRWPNVVRSTKMFMYVLAICHWNAALCKSALQGYETIWFHKDSVSNINTTRQNTGSSDEFLASAPDLPFYWAWLYVSVSTLCTLGLSGTTGLLYDGPAFIFIFLTFQMMMGLVLFAVTIGEILLIVDSLGAGRREFQMHLDAVKNFMGKREIPKPVTSKVIRWFDYIWESKRGFDEERRHIMVLPECLQADISLHAYLHTLKQVEFFRNTEAGFLKELVLKLKPVLFSPGEFVCRKGEIGRTMYIIEVGLLQVFSGKNVNVKPVAHLRRGQYFGELSILNMGKAGNRRTATIRSVGYSHLLSLCKDDLLSVLQDFPKERARLEYFAAKRSEKYHQEKMQEKLKRQQSRETINQIILSETAAVDNQISSWNATPNIGSNVAIVTESDRHFEEQSPDGSSSDSGTEDARAGVAGWNRSLAAELKPEEFASENNLLSANIEPDTTQMAGERRSSLNTHARRRSYRMRRSNLIARINQVNAVNGRLSTGSPLISRSVRSLEAITGRESVL